MKPFLTLLLSTQLLAAEDIDDPIRDHLEAMNPDRIDLSDDFSSFREFLRVSVWEVDIDNDGSAELMVGHTRPWTGDHTAYYWTIYDKKDDKYRKLTPPREDVRIPFSQDGGFFYLGEILPLGRRGILSVEEGVRAKPRLYNISRLFDIRDGKLVMEDMGPLDEENEEGRQFLSDYFDNPVVPSGEIKIVEVLSEDELEERGYDLGVWEKFRDGDGNSADGVEDPVTVDDLPTKSKWLAIAAVAVVCAIVSVVFYRLGKRRSV